MQQFCATYSLSIRTCSQVLQAADSLRAKHLKQHTDGSEPATFSIDVIQDETEGDASARLGATPLHKLLGMRMMLYLLHGREVLDPHGMLIFPPEVKRVVIDAGAHLCASIPSMLLHDIHTVILYLLLGFRR